jgi:hypothetical protein
MTEPAGLAVHAVVRNTRTDRALDALRLAGSGLEYELIPAGNLAAAVTPAPFRDVPEADPEALGRHERVAEALLRRSSVVPMPFGLVARDERAVREFLRARRVALEEGLDYLENSYEMRVHVSLRAAGQGEELGSYVRRLHGVLRGQSRAARRLGSGSGRELVAAFLVGRSEWLRLVEKATRWEGHHPDVELRITGPWPPYDFVSVVPPGGEPGGDGTDGAPREEGS